jgi:hypothetical protein
MNEKRKHNVVNNINSIELILEKLNALERIDKGKSFNQFVTSGIGK